MLTNRIVILIAISAVVGACGASAFDERSGDGASVPGGGGGSG